MGIGFLNCEANWSYSGFSRFKSRLPKRIPLAPIFTKSDVKGEYSVYECKCMVVVLKETLEDWNARQVADRGEDWEFDLYCLKELIKGMEWAISNNKPLQYV